MITHVTHPTKILDRRLKSGGGTMVSYIKKELNPIQRFGTFLQLEGPYNRKKKSNVLGNI